MLDSLSNISIKTNTIVSVPLFFSNDLQFKVMYLDKAVINYNKYHSGIPFNIKILLYLYF